MNRFKRYNNLLYFLIANHLPSSDSRFGAFLKNLRCRWAKSIISFCGKNVNIEPNCSFDMELKIGNNSGIGRYSEIHGDVSIGENVMMGPYCLIYSRNHSSSRTDIPMIQQGFENTKPVVIEDDVWIGGRVIILPGVHVGTGCVIGAGAVVTRDTPPYTIVAGNPAKIKKYRKE